jgi:hypothetical protein
MLDNAKVSGTSKNRELLSTPRLSSIFRRRDHANCRKVVNCRRGGSYLTGDKMNIPRIDSHLHWTHDDLLNPFRTRDLDGLFTSKFVFQSHPPHFFVVSAGGGGELPRFRSVAGAGFSPH